MNTKIHAVFIVLILILTGVGIGIGTKATKEKSSTEACQACWYQYYISVSAMMFSIAFIMSSVYYMVSHSSVSASSVQRFAQAPALFANHLKSFQLPPTIREL